MEDVILEPPAPTISGQEVAQDALLATLEAALLVALISMNARNL